MEGEIHTSLLKHLEPSWTYFYRSGLSEFAPWSSARGQPLSETEFELAEQLDEQSQSYIHLSVASTGITAA